MFRLIGGFGCVIVGTVLYELDNLYELDKLDAWSTLTKGYLSAATVHRLTGLAWGTGVVLLFDFLRDWQTLAVGGPVWRRSPDGKGWALKQMVGLQVVQLRRQGARGDASKQGGLGPSAPGASRPAEPIRESPTQGP
jgi:hypothetical protein